VLSWVVAGAGLLIALVSLVWVRRVSARLEALKQSYWELRYDYTRLRSQVARLDPEAAPTDPEPVASPSPATVSFVPLSTIRKKDR
jgi:uncharacterized membrane protein YjgN (DUF898 family)